MEAAFQADKIRELFGKGKYQECLAWLLPIAEKTSKEYRLIGTCNLKMKQWNEAAWAFHDAIQKGKHLSSYIGYIISINRIIGRKTIDKLIMEVNPFSFEYLINKSRDPGIFIELSLFFESKGFIEEAFELANAASEIKHRKDSGLEIRCLGLRSQLPNYRDHVILPYSKDGKTHTRSLLPLLNYNQYGRSNHQLNKYEKRAYASLIELFPRYSVLANVPLHSIFEPSVTSIAKPYRGEEFFYLSHLDFCLVNSQNLPVIGVELDSEYHDNDLQYLRDMAKNRIFKKGGIPLIRMRYFKDDYTSTDFRQYLVYQIFLSNVRVDFL